MRLIFDGHLDLALFALCHNRDQTESVAQINAREAHMTDALERGGATVSLPEMRRAGVAVCQSSIAVRANREVQPATGHRRIDLDYGTQRMAYAWGQGQLAYYRILEQQGEIKLIRTSAELGAHWQTWEQSGGESVPVGVILSMECADPIVEPSQAEAWWEDGLRSVMLAHFGFSHYAAGSGVSGPLTPKGIELLKEFDRVGMILDLTHLSEQSFYEALDRFSGPVIASHNNCRALVPGDRQFSDEQIQRLLERGAVIGVALDAWMLEPGWVHGESSTERVKLATVADHIDHVCQLAGMRPTQRLVRIRVLRTTCRLISGRRRICESWSRFSRSVAIVMRILITSSTLTGAGSLVGGCLNEYWLDLFWQGCYSSAG